MAWEIPYSYLNANWKEPFTLFTPPVSFELAVTTPGKSWMSGTDEQVHWKAPALQFLYICLSGRRQRNFAEGRKGEARFHLG